MWRKEVEFLLFLARSANFIEWNRSPYFPSSVLDFYNEKHNLLVKHENTSKILNEGYEKVVQGCEKVAQGK